MVRSYMHIGKFYFEFKDWGLRIFLTLVATTTYERFNRANVGQYLRSQKKLSRNYKNFVAF